MTRKRVAVLISGRGSNLQALLDAAADPAFPAEIVLVASNRPGAAGLERAQAAGVEARVVDHRSFGQGETGRAAFEAALTGALEAARTDIVCLAGFMRLLSAEFVERWRGRLINIHPSLLPAFKGLDVHERMLAAGVKIAGCTVHFVTPDMDAGPIIGQAAVAVDAGDDATSLAARILAEEHRLYPVCLRALAEGRAQLGEDGVVRLTGATLNGAILNPS